MSIRKHGAVATMPFAMATVALAAPSLAFAEEESAAGINILIPKLSEFIPALIAFLVIWFIFAKFAWPAVIGMLDKRQETIKNNLDEAEAAKTAETIGSLLSMAVKPGNSSIFVGKKEFEIMKKPGRGTHGHIAILTNNVDRAIYHLGQRGVKFDMDSKNVKDGKTVAIYFADEVAGFAIHLVQK